MSHRRQGLADGGGAWGGPPAGRSQLRTHVTLPSLLTCSHGGGGTCVRVVLWAGASAQGRVGLRVGAGEAALVSTLFLEVPPEGSGGLAPPPAGCTAQAARPAGCGGRGNGACVSHMSPHCHRDSNQGAGSEVRLGSGPGFGWNVRPYLPTGMGCISPLTQPRWPGLPHLPPGVGRLRPRLGPQLPLNAHTGSRPSACESNWEAPCAGAGLGGGDTV